MPAYRLADIINARRGFEAYCRTEASVKTGENPEEACRQKEDLQNKEGFWRGFYQNLAVLHGIQLPDISDSRYAQSVESLEKRCVAEWVPVWLHRQFHAGIESFGQVITAAPKLIVKIFAQLQIISGVPQQSVWQQPGWRASQNVEDLRVWQDWAQEVEKMETGIFSSRAQAPFLQALESSNQAAAQPFQTPGLQAQSPPVSRDGSPTGADSLNRADLPAFNDMGEKVPGLWVTNPAQGVSVLLVPGTQSGILLDPLGRVFQGLASSQAVDLEKQNRGAASAPLVWESLQKAMRERGVEQIELIVGPKQDQEAWVSSGNFRDRINLPVIFSRQARFMPWNDFKTQIALRNRRLPFSVQKSTPSVLPDNQAPQSVESNTLETLTSPKKMLFGGELNVEASKGTGGHLQEVRGEEARPSLPAEKFFKLWPLGKASQPDPSAINSRSEQGAVFAISRTPAKPDWIGDEESEAAGKFGFHFPANMQSTERKIWKASLAGRAAGMPGNEWQPARGGTSLPLNPDTMSMPVLANMAPQSSGMPFLGKFPQLLSEAEGVTPLKRGSSIMGFLRIPEPIWPPVSKPPQIAIFQPVEAPAMFFLEKVTAPSEAGRDSGKFQGANISAAPSCVSSPAPMVFVQNPKPGSQRDAGHEKEQVKTPLVPKAVQGARPALRVHLASQERDEAEPWAGQPAPGRKASVAKLAGEFCRWFLKRRQLKAEQEFSGAESHGAYY